MIVPFPRYPAPPIVISDLNVLCKYGKLAFKAARILCKKAKAKGKAHRQLLELLQIPVYKTAGLRGVNHASEN